MDLAVTTGWVFPQTLVMSSATDGNVNRYDTETGTTDSFTGTAGLTATHGAVDPANGIYYYGNINGSDNGATVYALDTAGGDYLGEVATISFGRVSPGGNGDWAFDSQGNLYLTAGSTSSNDLYVVSAALPTADVTPVNVSASLLTNIRTTEAINGIAFGADGYLYPASGARIYRVNPTTGDVPSSQPLTAGTGSVDLASCASPSTITAQKDVVRRVKPTDQFQLTVTGGGLATNNSGTTTGTDVGLQTADAETAGPLLGLPGTQYTVTETAFGGTDLADYTTTWECPQHLGG